MSPAAFELIRRTAYGRGVAAGYDFALQRNYLTSYQVELHAARYAGMVQTPPEWLTDSQRLTWFNLSRGGFRYGATYTRRATPLIPYGVYATLSS